MQKGTMRPLLIGLLGAAMFSGAAAAADMGRPVYKAPPAGVMAPTVYDWTGFYVGGHVGYGWSTRNWNDSSGLFNVSHDADGFLGGGQVGFNYQIGQFVLGVEGDMSWSGISGSSNVGAVGFNTDVDWTATLTGRAGIAFDRWLVYGKGGVAWAADKYSTNFYSIPTIELSQTRTGWTAGAGVEYAFAQQWTAKLEYNYMDFGTDRVSFAPGWATDIDQKIHTVKFGINYKFGVPGALLARY